MRNLTLSSENAFLWYYNIAFFDCVQKISSLTTLLKWFKIYFYSFSLWRLFLDLSRLRWKIWFSSTFCSSCSLELGNHRSSLPPCPHPPSLFSKLCVSFLILNSSCPNCCPSCFCPGPSTHVPAPPHRFLSTGSEVGWHGFPAWKDGRKLIEIWRISWRIKFSQRLWNYSHMVWHIFL